MNGDTPIAVTGQPSTDGSMPALQNLSSLLAPAQGTQQQTTTTAQAPPQRDLSQENQYIVHATHYGYKGDPDADPNSQKGIGAWNNSLSGGTSIALTPDLEQRFNAQPGEAFVFTDRNGAQHNFTFGDRTSRDLRGRIDVYDPTGQIGDLGEGTISRPGATGPAIPALETSNTEIQKQPAAFGMRVATQDDVTNYNAYVQNGGDPNQIPIQDRLAVAIAKDPKFLTKPENFEAFYGLVWKPLQQQSAGEQFNQAVMNLGPTIGQTLSNVGQGIANEAALAKDSAELSFRKATSNVYDPGYQKLTDRVAQEGATQVQGFGQGISDAWNLVTGVYNGLIQTTHPVFGLLANDAKSRDDLDRQYAQAMQQTVGAQQQLAGLGKGMQNLVANAYKVAGAQDLAQKIQQAQPNQAAVQGIATVSNILNYIPLGAGEAVNAFKTIGFEKGLQAAEDLAGANAKKLVLDTTQMLPENPGLSAANPGYIEGRNLQAQFAPAARNAAQDVADKTNILNQQLTNLGKIAGDPGTVTGAFGNVLQGAGTGLEAIGDAARKVSQMPEAMAGWVSGGNETVKNVVQSAIEKTVFGGFLESMGPIGGAVSVALEHAPDLADSFSGLLKNMGKELTYGEATIPYWQRVFGQTKGLPKYLAQALDSPAVQTAGELFKGGAAGAATGAALGGLQQAGSVPGGGIAGAVGGAAQGGILGMAGAGLGQWQRFRDPNQYLLQARGDWKRYRDTLSPLDQGNFGQLSPTNQLMLAQSAQHFPGLRVNYTNNPTGPQGLHYLDPGGRSNIQINLANPNSVVRGIMAHELIHAASTSGMLPDLYDSLFGNPQTGKAGQYTALDASGTPIGVNPATGRYFVNQDFNNLSTQYTNKLAQNGLPTSHIGDFDIAKEIYAEHGVDYMLSGAPILDSNSAFRPGLASTNAVKTSLAKMGYTFDDAGRMIGAPGGTIGGTGLFNDLQRNPDLRGMAQSFFQKTWNDGKIDSEEQVTHRFTKQDLQNPNVAATWLTNAAEIMRKQDGTPMVDPNTGLPLMRSPKEVKDYNAGFAQAVRSGLDTLPEDQRMALGMRREGDNVFARYLPDNLLDSLAGTNQYNPHQIASLRMLSRVLADKGNPGMEMRFFYHKALSAGKRYGSFEGTEKIAVPYGIEITGDNNVNIKSVDFNQLTNNYLGQRNREPFKTLWNSPADFANDAHTYFTNHSQGRPGADAIGEQKRDAINALANFGTQVQRDANPLVDRMPASVRPIIKSYRIDRANQITPTGAMRPFISEEQYYKMNRNYLPRGGAFKSVSPEDFVQARDKSDRPQFLSELKAGDLRDHKLFTNEDGTVGAAIDPKGDIKNVFNNSGVKGAGSDAIAHAIGQGGRTLDAFDFGGFLPRLYRQFGFQETGRMKFSDEAAPANWDYTKYGRPDVVFMGWNGYPQGSRKAAIERAQGPEIHWLPNERSTKYSGDWDRQKQLSRTFATGTPDYRVPGEVGRTQTYAAGGQRGIGSGEASGASVAPDNTAIPVTMRTTRTGNEEPEKIDYGITSAPLVADKQPPSNLKANNFEHVDFLTKPEQQKLTHLDKASAVTDYADKIVDEFGKFKDNKEVMAAKSWYRDVRKYLTKTFGGDRETFAHLLAATSSGQGVIQNWKDALEAYQRYRTGAYDDAIREFKRTGKITEDMKPAKASGALFGRNSDAVLKVLSGTWLDSVEGPKTPNFFRNLFGRGTDATIDVWAARLMRRLGNEGVEDAPGQWRLTPPSEGAVSNLDFAFSQQAFKQAADRLGMKAHDLQAVMWYAEKHLWAERGWSKGGAAAAMESYIPRLKDLEEQVTAAGGPKAAGYLPRLQKYVQGR